MMNYESFEQIFDFSTAAALGIVVAFLLIFVLIVLAFSLVSYVLTARSMHMIAQRRGIRNSWLAWIPVVNVWIMGSISDQYQYVVKGKIRNRRKVLLGVSIATNVMVAVIQVLNVILGFVGTGGVTALTAVITALSLVMTPVSIVFAVFQYIALYDLYASCEPGNSVLYLVLSIVFSITMPIFMFLCRKKDGGMPARKQPKPVIPEVLAPAEEAVVEEAIVEVPVEEAAEEAPAAEAQEEAAPVEETSAEKITAEDATESE